MFTYIPTIGAILSKFIVTNNPIPVHKPIAANLAKGTGTGK